MHAPFEEHWKGIMRGMINLMEARGLVGKGAESRAKSFPPPGLLKSDHNRRVKELRTSWCTPGSTTGWTPWSISVSLPLGFNLKKVVPAQVLVQAQLQGCNGILMPWWAFLQWAGAPLLSRNMLPKRFFCWSFSIIFCGLAKPKDWTRRYRDRLEKVSAEIDWQDRQAVLFWRGSDTGCFLSSCGQWRSVKGNHKAVQSLPRLAS